MARRRRIYEGKEKTLYDGPEPGTIVLSFKDDVTSEDGQKKGTITGKGVLNNRISEFIMMRLHDIGVPTHFVRRLNMREQLVREVEIVPVEVVVRNIAAGSICKRFNIEEGTPLPRSIVEYRDPLQLKEFIRDPQSFRYTRMPANPQLSDRDLDDLVAYFHAMRARKQVPGEAG